MAEYRVTLNFSDKEEKDMNNLVGELAASRKLGAYISNIVRLAYDNPELVGVAINTKAGTITRARRQMLNECEAKYNELNAKVDKLLDMCEEMYTLTKFGKRLGLESKTKNMLQAAFMADRQLKELDTLGFSCREVEEELPSEVEERCDKTLELILTSYSDIVNEVRESRERVVTVREESDINKIAT